MKKTTILLIVNLAISGLIVYFGQWWQIIAWAVVQLFNGCGWFGFYISVVNEAMSPKQTFNFLIAWQRWQLSFVHMVVGFLVAGLYPQQGIVLAGIGVVHLLGYLWWKWTVRDPKETIVN